MESSLNWELSMLSRLTSDAGWYCQDRSILEAAPHMARQFNAKDLVATLRNLGIQVSAIACSLRRISKSDCPALFVSHTGSIQAIFDHSDGKILRCESGDRAANWTVPERLDGTLIRIESAGVGNVADTNPGFSTIIAQFRNLLPGLIIVSFMTNLMALGTPLLIMAIYDRVIPTKSTELALSLVLAVVLVLVADAGFRAARTAVVAHMGAQVESQLGLALFRKLTGLGLRELQKSDVESQIIRLKQFEGLRDIFTGQILTTLLDLPFTLLFLAFLFVLAPPIGFLILGLGLVFILATWLTLPTQQGLNQAASRAKSTHQALMFEATNHQRAVYRLGLGSNWRQRHEAALQSAASKARRARQFQLVSQAFGQALMTIAGVGAIVFGTMAAMDGSMSFGALIAVMALVWKVLTPIQSLYVNAPQIQNFLKSRRQVDRVLALPQEFVRGAAHNHHKTFSGALSMSGVTHRYGPQQDPALVQVSLSIAAREFVIICGPSGGGKSTLLNLMDGLYRPVAGTMHLDGVDYRQIAVDDLRHGISFAQQTPDLFHGTIAQNFRLTCPTLRDQDVADAIRRMDLWQELGAPPHGLDTRLTEKFRRTMSGSYVRALALARNLCKPAAIYLLDDPSHGLDQRRGKALADWLGQIKGHHTVVLVSNDPAHLSLADRYVYLAKGRVVANDTGAVGLKKIRALIAADHRG